MAPRKLTLNDYEITRDGQIINKITGHILKPQLNNRGYFRVCIGGQFYFVHRLVAEKYVPNPLNKPHVNHIDGIKTHNFDTNLEWVDNSENKQHAVDTHLIPTGEKCSWSKLTAEDVRYIRDNYPAFTQKQLAEKFGVSRSTLGDIINNRTWKN